MSEYNSDPEIAIGFLILLTGVVIIFLLAWFT